MFAIKYRTTRGIMMAGTVIGVVYTMFYFVQAFAIQIFQELSRGSQSKKPAARKCYDFEKHEDDPTGDVYFNEWENEVLLYQVLLAFFSNLLFIEWALADLKSLRRSNRAIGWGEYFKRVFCCKRVKTLDGKTSTDRVMYESEELEAASLSLHEQEPEEGESSIMEAFFER